MKATLEFDLKDDAMAHLRCVKATEMALVIWEFLHNSRKEMEQELDKDTLDAVYREFYNLLDKYDINIDELIE